MTQDNLPSDLAKIPYVDLARRTAPLREEILRAVAVVLDHGRFILGPEVGEFEEAFARLCRSPYAVGVNSGMDALVLSLEALGVGPGDEVITQPNSFVASTSCIRRVGATPVFADVGDDYNLDPDAVEAAVTPKTRALLPVHLTGRPSQMDRLMKIAQKHGLLVIEDAAQAVGASLHGTPVGSFGDAGAFSLHPLKNLNACGDGGVVVTESNDLAEKIRIKRNLGLRTREDCVEWAGNSRLDTLQAAILNVKLKHLEAVCATRRKNASRYHANLASVEGIVLPKERSGEFSVYHTFVVRVQRREALREFLTQREIGTQVHYPVPIHLSTAGKTLGYARGDFPITELQSTQILSLPIEEGLTESEIDSVSDAIREFYK